MPPKRKLPSMGLERRVKARKEEDWDPDMEVSEDGSDSDQVSEEGIGERAGHDEESELDDEDGSEDQSDSGPEEAAPRPKVDLSSISFGALAKAQESLPQSSRRRKQKTSAPDEDEEITRKDTHSSRSAATKKSTAKPPARTSKNAPQEQSSKHPVSRRREILSDPRRAARDPRFDTLGGSSAADEAKASKAYSFLDQYRESEMAELRKAIKKTTDEAQKARLKRELHSMESRKKTQERKAEAERVIKEHREQEKEMVAKGKTPFYLKKSEQKKRALTDRFKGMSKGQVDRAIERKRKKVAGKEKKELGSMERVRRRD